jgi:hypothetical protein
VAKIGLSMKKWVTARSCFSLGRQAFGQPWPSVSAS